MKAFAILTLALGTAFSVSAERLSLQTLTEHLFTNAVVLWQALTDAQDEADDFTQTMEWHRWKSGLNLAEGKLTVQSLTGSGTPFNQVNLGLLLMHGAYGTSMDCTANNCMQMYFPITSGTSGQYLSMSQMNLGGAGTNGLKWMAIFACQSLYHVNWQSMQNQHVYPYNGNLHLLLGSDTVCYGGFALTSIWVTYMVQGLSNATYSPLTIQNAWYHAAAFVYANSGQNYGTTINLAVAGDVACMNDMLQTSTNSTPSGTWTYVSKEVWPTFTP